MNKNKCKDILIPQYTKYKYTKYNIQKHNIRKNVNTFSLHTFFLMSQIYVQSSGRA